MKLTGSELATVLYALRRVEEEVRENDGDTSPMKRDAHFIDDEPLTADEISDLCERLNTEDGTDEALRLAKEYKEGVPAPLQVSHEEFTRGWYQGQKALRQTLSRIVEALS